MDIKNNDINNLFTFADTIIPSDEIMPAASEIISSEDFKWILENNNKYVDSIKDCLNFIKKEPSTRVVGGIQELNEDHRVEILSLMQSVIPVQFNLFIEVIYLLYYSKEKIHEIIGWNTDESSVENKMIPFDSTILENVKKREPFWKKV
jgi:hypothetical protein